MNVHCARLSLLPGGEGDASLEDGGGGAVLMSAKEERDMEELLELFSMGIGDVAGFEERLREEYELLEVRCRECLLLGIDVCTTAESAAFVCTPNSAWTSTTSQAGIMYE